MTEVNEIAEALQRIGLQPDLAAQLAGPIAATGGAELGGVRYTATPTPHPGWNITIDFGFAADRYLVTPTGISRATSPENTT